MRLDLGVGVGLEGDGDEVVGVVSCETKIYTKINLLNPKVEGNTSVINKFFFKQGNIFNFIFFGKSTIYGSICLIRGLN